MKPLNSSIHFLSLFSYKVVFLPLYVDVKEPVGLVALPFVQLPESPLLSELGI